MLVLQINQTEVFNDETQKFEHIPNTGTPLQLEHSLFAITKWEAYYEKPFLDAIAKTNEETLSYIRFMALDEKFPPELFSDITDEHIAEVSKYIDAKMTATWFTNPPGPTSKAKEVVTSELIYYWLIALTIPWETQYWHLNRLLTLVKVCNQKNQPPKKMSRRDIAERNRALNAQRKAESGTSG